MSETKYILSLSYGKDSLACLGAIKALGYPLDGIIHAEVWATDTIPADLPPMVSFKEKADKFIKDEFGLNVIHTCAMRERERERVTYEKQFYSKYEQRKNSSGTSDMYGFPRTIGAWCNDRLKVKALSKSNIRKAVLSNTSEKRKQISGNNKADINIVQYLGIAADEPIRIARHTGKTDIILPLVDIGWDEAYCRQWCEERDLLSPIYTTATRGGCWFCHNQGVDQLRLLRKNYPDLWQLLLKWDSDSPVTFKSDGHTVHDFDKRFAAEDRGEITPGDKSFRWSTIL